MRHLLLYILLLLTHTLTAQSIADLRIKLDGQQLTFAEAKDATHSPGFSYYLDRSKSSEALQLGTTESDGGQSVNENTAFQIGSPSSALLAFTTLQLATKGLIDLDRPVNDYLKRWKVPGRKANSFTVIDLLLNKGRFGTDYKPEGYLAKEELPTLLEIINGSEPAQNRKFVFKGERKPGKGLEYGGWLVLQLLLEDQLGKPLAELIQERVLTPLKMSDSFYAVELSPKQLQVTAKGHDKNGTQLGNGYTRYPEQANHGLWSTPKDYSRLVRHVLEAAKGKDNRFISQELAQQSITRQYGQRSLIFHIDEYQNPFWGGATNGFYFYMQANAKEDYVVVSASNRQLNWQLCNKACWAAYPLVKALNQTNKLGIFYQKTDKAILDQLLPELKKVCKELDTRIELIPAEKGVPDDITATPAFVFQNETGRSIHAGKHLDIDAITIFLKSNLYAPRFNQADTRESTLIGVFGRQQVAIPLKVTEVKGDISGLIKSLDFAAQLKRCYFEVSNGNYQEKEVASLLATDRRFYLDVHPYQLKNGELLLSYAIFSQFNCHEQLMDNYGDPIRVKQESLSEGICELAENSLAQIEAFRINVTNSECPNPLAENTPLTDWKTLGWKLSTPQFQSTAPSETVYLPAVLSTIRPLQAGLPAIQFNFPAPLDRYAGSVENISGKLAFSDGQTSLSGQFIVELSSLTMGNSSLDNYVLGEALNAKKHPTATLKFTDAKLPAGAMSTTKNEVNIPAIFTLKGKEVPVVIKANFTPQLDAAGQPQLKTVTEFGINIKQLFGLKGPDGPKKVKDLVMVRGVFLMG